MCRSAYCMAGSGIRWVCEWVNVRHEVLSVFTRVHYSAKNTVHLAIFFVKSEVFIQTFYSTENSGVQSVQSTQCTNEQRMI